MGYAHHHGWTCIRISGKELLAIRSPSDILGHAIRAGFAAFCVFFFFLSPAWRGNPLLIVMLGLPEMFITYFSLILVLGRPPRPAR